MEFLKLDFNTEKVQKMQNMFSSCLKLTSLNITTFNTSSCKNFDNIFLNDENLNLYIDSKMCQNLMEKIPDFIKIHDISNN